MAYESVEQRQATAELDYLGEYLLVDLLVEKLKGKPVYNTLKRIRNGRAKNVYEELKGLFSLGVHVCIECERGNNEYQTLLEQVYRKIGGILLVQKAGGVK